MARRKPRTKAGKQRKIRKVMHEFKSGSLRSGSGRKVRSRRQAVAIAMRMAGKARRRRKR